MAARAAREALESFLARRGDDFRVFWKSRASERARISILTTAMVLLERRLETPAARQQFALLCPEFRLDRLARLAPCVNGPCLRVPAPPSSPAPRRPGLPLLSCISCSEDMVPVLMRVRVENPEACHTHDMSFVRSNLPSAPTEALETLASAREHFVLTFLHDVLTVALHTAENDVALPTTVGTRHLRSWADLVQAAAPLEPLWESSAASLTATPTPDAPAWSLAVPPADSELESAADTGTAGGVEAGGAAGSPARVARAAARDPVREAARWIQLAEASGAVRPDGIPIALATADPDSLMPSVRMVLLKSVDARGFVFFTNGESSKGEELARNPRASFTWFLAKPREPTSSSASSSASSSSASSSSSSASSSSASSASSTSPSSTSHPLPSSSSAPSLSEWQLRVQGVVERVTDEEADRYFASRSRRSQIGAWASAQSRPVADSASLHARWDEVTAEHEARGPDAPVPRPPHWTGFRIVPTLVEFWASGPHRLHDRVRFTRAVRPDESSETRTAASAGAATDGVAGGGGEGGGGGSKDASAAAASTASGGSGSGDAGMKDAWSTAGELLRALAREESARSWSAQRLYP